MSAHYSISRSHLLLYIVKEPLSDSDSRAFNAQSVSVELVEID